MTTLCALAPWRETIVFGLWNRFTDRFIYFRRFFLLQKYQNSGSLFITNFNTQNIINVFCNSNFCNFATLHLCVFA